MSKNISNLSDAKLIEKLVVLSTREREVTAEVLLHLIELDKRKLYREQGYPSLYAYCVGGLRYSETAAKRRITAARCIADFPEVYQMFLKKELSLTTISIIAPVLNVENRQRILSEVVGKSRVEAEWLAGQYSPKKLSWDKIVPIVVERCADLNESLKTVSCANNKNLELNLGPLRTQVEKSGMNGHQVSFDECYKLEFSVSKGFKNKLDLVKSLASGRLEPGAKLEKVFELMLDEFINRHSPEQREERRKARKEKQLQRKKLAERCREYSAPTYRLNIPQPTRDKVFVRDGFKCTFVSDDGVQCNATTGLHLDHVQPRGLGGSHAVENLRVLCGAHNRLVAERAYGREFMEQFY